jgi:PAS domain S-box-containing protein
MGTLSTLRFDAMSDTDRRRRSSIDRIRAALLPGVRPDHSAPTGELTHAEIETIRETSLDISASLNVREVLSTIAERAVDLIRASASLVYLIDRNTGALQLMTGHNIPGAYLGQMLQPGEDLAGRVAVTGRTLVVDNYPAWEERSGLFAQIDPGSSLCRATSVVGIPLTYSQQALGILQVLYTDGREFSNKDIALLQIIAPNAATAIAHAQLFERNQQIMNLLELINDRAAAVSSVGTAVINAGHSLTKMSVETLHRTISALRLSAGKIYLKEPGSADLIATASHTLALEEDGSGLQRVAAHCAHVRQTVLLQNMAAFPWSKNVVAWLADRKLGALVCLPLIADDEVVGVLQTIAPLGRQFETGELDTLHIITGQLALGVANARLFVRVRAEQQQLKAILSSSGDAIIGLDAAGRIQLANPAAERAFGLNAKRALGQLLSAVTDNTAFNTGLETARNTPQPQPLGFEVTLPSDAVLFCNLSPIVDPSGDLSGWVAVLQDITRFKETERLKSDMILTASHDLRNPVSLTMGALDLLGRVTPEWNEVQQGAYDLSQLGIHRIEALISDLLDLERIEQRVGLKLTDCDLGEIAQTIVTELSLQAQERQHQLKFERAGAAIQVRGDAQRLYQVISNLLSNAIKYTPNGGVVTLAMWAQGDQTRLDVRDTGPGIPPEAQARVFERFYRVPGSNTEERGTGLGLAIVKTIIEQHSGRVWVTSVVGQGSTFSIALPRLTPDA